MITYLWCDLGESVGSRTCYVFYLIEVLIRRGTFCWKPHLNRTSGSKVINNWKILKTIENKWNAFLFLAVSYNQCSWLLTDPARSQHIWYNVHVWLIGRLQVIKLFNRGYSSFQVEPTTKVFVTRFTPVLVFIHFHFDIYLN